jgi:hypothetical protein
MAIGLARRALDEVEGHLQGGRSVLLEPLQEQRERLEHTVDALKQGLHDGRFLSQPGALFQIRIALAESAANAVQLELQSSGGKAYLTEHGSGFARRWRESAFVPIVTPSLVQLRAELQAETGSDGMTAPVLEARASAWATREQAGTVLEQFDRRSPAKW